MKYEVVEIASGEVVSQHRKFRNAVLSWIGYEGSEAYPGRYKQDTYNIREDGKFLDPQERDRLVEELCLADESVEEAFEAGFS